MERLEPVVSPQRVQERIAEVAGEISSAYRDAREPLVLVCVLKGAFIFCADLVRQLDFEPEIEFVRLASYGSGTVAEQELSFTKDVESSLRDKHVLIVEDILDTGRTVAYLSRVFSSKSPASLRICSLIHKLERRSADIDPHFTGFTVEKGFLVGCGLDYAHKYRNKSGIYEVVFSGQSSGD